MKISLVFEADILVTGASMAGKRVTGAIMFKEVFSEPIAALLKLVAIMVKKVFT